MRPRLFLENPVCSCPLGVCHPGVVLDHNQRQLIPTTRNLQLVWDGLRRAPLRSRMGVTPLETN